MFIEDTYIKWRKHNNVRPLVLSNKMQYYSDLSIIEDSFSGRIDATSTNTFIFEAVQLLVNAIELFEQGYFDCAYYSLRSAIDVSTTMVYLFDMPNDERQKSLQAWKSKDAFPMQSQMIKELSKQGDVFADMKSKMPDFFENAKSLSAKLNKYVHKQGFSNFYVSRNHPINQKKPQDQFVQNFDYYLNKCIGVVAVMRLAIDPFPVLLMDEEMLYRCFDSLTEPYNEDFVQKYIGMDILNQYMQTEIYKATKSSILSMEKKNSATFDVIKYQYIDTQQMMDIFQQFHLLSIHDKICVLIVASCSKTVNVYCYNGMIMYSTDRKTKRTALSLSGYRFLEFAKAESQINQTYDEAFISVFKFVGTDYFIEHNEPLSEEEVETINNRINIFLERNDISNN